MGRDEAEAVAGRLIDRFGSLGDVVRGDRAAFSRIGELAAWELIAPVDRAIGHLAVSDMRRGPIFERWAQVAAHLRLLSAMEPVEHFRALFLDCNDRLIADTFKVRGSVDHCPVCVRALIGAALNSGCVAMVLVHNHPSGDPTISAPDLDLTKRVVAAARPLGITVHDHLIVARGGITSFRDRGLL